jgi:hypothetical protein
MIQKKVGGPRWLGLSQKKKFIKLEDNNQNIKTHCIEQ